jgi:hypothetical protein
MDTPDHTAAPVSASVSAPSLESPVTPEPALAIPAVVETPAVAPGDVPAEVEKPLIDYVDLLYVAAMAVVAFLITFLLARKHLPGLLERP